MSRVEFRPAAAADIDGLGERFLAAVGDAVALIAESPLQFAVLHRETRRVLLRRFPYGVYYRMLDGRVLVVACIHARRDARHWRNRR